MSARRRRTGGMSLLEVIIATSILAASAVMLTSLFSTGDRHTVRAHRRTMAHMLCEAKLEELIAAPANLQSVDAAPFERYPNWVWATDIQATSLPGLIEVQVRVMEIPGVPGRAELALATEAERAVAIRFDPRTVKDEPTYALSRLVRYDGEVAELGNESPPSLADRLQQYFETHPAQ